MFESERVGLCGAFLWEWWGGNNGDIGIVFSFSLFFWVGDKENHRLYKKISLLSECIPCVVLNNIIVLCTMLLCFSAANQKVMFLPVLCGQTQCRNKVAPFLPTPFLLLLRKSLSPVVVLHSLPPRTLCSSQAHLDFDSPKDTETTSLRSRGDEWSSRGTNIPYLYRNER